MCNISINGDLIIVKNMPQFDFVTFGLCTHLAVIIRALYNRFVEYCATKGLWGHLKIPFLKGFLNLRVTDHFFFSMWSHCSSSSCSSSQGSATSGPQTNPSPVILSVQGAQVSCLYCVTLRDLCDF